MLIALELGDVGPAPKLGLPHRSVGLTICSRHPQPSNLNADATADDEEKILDRLGVDNPPIPHPQRFSIISAHLRQNTRR